LDIKFYTKDPSYRSLFQGFPYDGVMNNSTNPDIIKPFLDHVINIIAHSNNDLYHDILNWYRFYFKIQDLKLKRRL
jgi:hypothetical protein